MRPSKPHRPWAPRGLGETRSVSSVEFALMVPIIFTLVAAVYDIARALIAWEEVNNAASAVVQAAQKLSVSAGTPVTQLTYTQMQTAMTSVYAQMPRLNLGNGTGMFNGPFAVTLSGVEYYPTCTYTNFASCTGGPQTPYTLWSSNLTFGGQELLKPVPGQTNTLLRACGPLTPVASFPNNANQLNVMISPVLAGTTSMTMAPQVVADVRYTFSPYFFFFVKSVTFWASATMPSPVGDPSTPISFNSTDDNGNVVGCTIP